MTGADVVRALREWIEQQRPADPRCHEYHAGRDEQLDRLSARLDGIATRVADGLPHGGHA